MLVEVFFWERWDLDLIDRICQKYDLRSVFLGTAQSLEFDVERQLFHRFTVKQWDQTIRFPIHNLYETPETLGRDRIAAVTGAWKIFQQDPCVVVDAGTCITIDYISKGIFEGGNISPGINMRFRAMHGQTHSLPLVEVGETNRLLGKNTREAIRLGGQMGAVLEIKGWLHVLKTRYGAFNVILTGGDAPLISEMLGSEFMVNQHLVLIGLNTIYRYNANLQE